jgi:hypothetical protein
MMTMNHDLLLVKATTLEGRTQGLRQVRAHCRH